MPAIDLSILNQRQTPAFYADVFANRPAAGFVGRIFVSTNTFAFYRDNGTGWDLIGGPGTGTVTGSGAAGQVAFWSGSSLISGENNLWWDSTNNHFGINTNTPGTAADIHHDQSTILQLNQTTATNDTRIAFQNGGSSKWRVGNFYNLGSNDYAVNDATLNINRFTVKSSSGQTFVGDETTSSGLFVVNNSSGDAHIVALGATAPSIRVRNAGVGASLQFGLGLATTTNNFIQGATGGEFCIFNDSLTAQPILFGIKDAGLGNTQEAARISAARNFLVGTTTDNGNKFQVNGSAFFNSNLIVQAPASTLFMSLRGRSSDNFGFIGFYDNTGATRYGYIQSHSANGGQLNITMDGGAQIIGDSRGLLLQPSAGNVGIGVSSLSAFGSQVTALQMPQGVTLYAWNASAVPQLYLGANNYFDGSNFKYIISGQAASLYYQASGAHIWYNAASGTAGNNISLSQPMTLAATGNLLIGTTTDAGYKLAVNGSAIIGNPATNSNYGGFAFFTLFVIPGTTTNFFQVPGSNNWGGITEISWVSSADANRSGAALLRWAYDSGTGNTGVVYTLYNNNQNAVGTFDFSGGYLRLTITGGGSNYYVQIRVQGSQSV